MRSAIVKVKNRIAGRLTQDEQGYHFAYAADYLAWKEATPVSLTLPLRSEPYHAQVLFPFFDGLIPEGWLLDIAQKKLEAKPTGSHGFTIGLL